MEVRTPDRWDNMWQDTRPIMNAWSNWNERLYGQAGYPTYAGFLSYIPEVPDLHVNRPLRWYVLQKNEKIVNVGQKFFLLKLKSFLPCLHIGRAFRRNILTEKSNNLAKEGSVVMFPWKHVCLRVLFPSKNRQSIAIFPWFSLNYPIVFEKGKDYRYINFLPWFMINKMLSL